MGQTSAIKILVTGFGPFPGRPSNPSGQMLDWLGERPFFSRGNFELRTALIPTSWAAARDFVTGELACYDPDVALHFGVSARARGFRIERFARNCANTHADVEGRCFAGQLVKKAPDTLRATIGAPAMAAALRARGLPASTSHEAGRYLCNMLFYLSLNQAMESGRTRQTGFIHVPPLAAPGERGGVFDRPCLLEGVEAITAKSLAAARRARLAG